jgi:hypothetical protein
MMDANMTLVLMIAQMIAQTPYDLTAYNCWDYSTDLRNALIKEGESARIANGMCNWSSQPHAWVEVGTVWINANDGTILNHDTCRKAGYSPPKFNPLKAKWLNEHE